LEAEGINALSASLDDKFTAALDALAAVTGRVIVTGMGKSGHIARKIAATLASTGTPAYFVHPGEASHGDLGMIAHDDAVIALSNSGNTQELNDLLEYAKRFSIPLIAITARANSMMAELADTALILPPVPEGCPMGLAPTTSTTMQLALGDAIAVALLERRGFSTTDFQVFHPGGQLGNKLLRVSDLMHSGADMPLTTPDTPMSEAVLTMTEKRFGCVGVVDDTGLLIGVITDGDLRRHMSSDMLSLRAGDIMTSNPRTIRSSALAAEAVAFMNTSTPPFLCVFVVDGASSSSGAPTGILHMHDCLQAGIR
jgi:arabinose-5-phosphate isomerase